MSKLQNYKSLMTNRHFLSLWSGSLLSGIGDAVISVSLVWMVYKQTGNPFLLSLTLICLEFPKILAAPLFGVLLDRFPAIVFAVLSNIISGCMFIFLAFTSLDNPLGYIPFLGLIVLTSSLAPVTKSCTNIIITETVERERWIPANSLMNIQFDMALSLGPVVGGVLLAFGHMTAAYLFDAVTFFLAAGLYYVAMPAHARTKRKEVLGEKSFVARMSTWKRELKEGFAWLYNSTTARAVVFANFIWNFLIWGTSAALLPIYSDQQLAAGASGYGILTAMLSVGIVFGSFLTGALQVDKFSLKTLVFLSMALHGVTYGLLSLQVHVSVAMIVLVFCGIISSPAMIYNRTFMQTVVPEKLRGRVFTLSAALGSLGYPLGTTLAATTVRAVRDQNVAILFLVFGAVTAVLILLLWWTTARIDRDLDTPIAT